MSHKQHPKMKIGILGTGNIGKVLSLRLSAAGHDVKVANSRGPSTIPVEVLANGSKAVEAAEAIKDVDVVVVSMNPTNLAKLGQSGFFSKLPAETVLIDTSNYYPHRDQAIPEIDGGKVESEWVVEQLGRPLAKAWNAIGAGSFENKAKTAGAAGRLAIPYASDRENDDRVTAQLINDTGFNAVRSGSLAESWRQQPGAPGYCTDLTETELVDALKRADRARLPKRRDLIIAVLTERMTGGSGEWDWSLFPGWDWGVELNRVIAM